MSTPLLDAWRPQTKEMSLIGAMNLTAEQAGAAGGVGFSVSYGGWGERAMHRLWREWADSNWLLYSMNAMRAHQASAADWDIVVVDRNKPHNAGVLNDLRDYFGAPNPGGANNSIGEIIRAATPDVLTLDSGALQRHGELGGITDNLEVLDGARVVPKPRWKTEQDGPRYVYLDDDWTGRGKEMRDDELLHIVANPQSFRPSGLAPVKVLYRVLLAEYDTFRSIHILQKNRMPSALLKVPNTSPETIEQLKDLFLNELAGQSGLGFADLPPETELIELASANLAEQGAFAFYDLLVRASVAVYRTTTLAISWLQDTNRATAREQAELIDEGLLALLRLWQQIFNLGVIRTWPGADNIGFRFMTLATRDEAQQARTIRERMGPSINWMSINQACIADGLPTWEPVSKGGTIPDDAMPWVEQPLVPAGNGLQLPVSVAAEQYLAQSVRAEEIATGSTAAIDELEATGDLLDQLATVSTTPPTGNGNAGTPPPNGNGRPALPAKQARPVPPAHLRRPEVGHALGAPEHEVADGVQQMVDDLDAIFDEVRQRRAARPG